MEYQVGTASRNHEQNLRRDYRVGFASMIAMIKWEMTEEQEQRIILGLRAEFAQGESHGHIQD